MIKTWRKIFNRSGNESVEDGMSVIGVSLFYDFNCTSSYSYTANCDGILVISWNMIDFLILTIVGDKAVKMVLSFGACYKTFPAISQDNQAWDLIYHTDEGIYSVLCIIFQPKYM